MAFAPFRLDVNVAYGAIDQIGLLLSRSKNSLGESADAGEGEVPADRHGLHEAVALPVLGHEHQPAGDPLRNAQSGDVLAVQQNAAAGRPQPTSDALHHLRPAGAHKAVDANDLAGAHVKRDAIDHGVERRRAQARSDSRC